MILPATEKGRRVGGKKNDVERRKKKERKGGKTGRKEEDTERQEKEKSKPFEMVCRNDE